MSWLIVGVSGVTNGGKSCLTQSLIKKLPPSTKLICQDDYFYPQDSPHHVAANNFPSHFNWDVITSINTEKMFKDVSSVLSSSPSINLNNTLNHKPILLLDGFLLFDDDRIANLCNLKYFFTLSREQCLARRSLRTYDPPDIPGYFNACVWPMYEDHLGRIRSKISNISYLDGSDDMDAIHEDVYKEIVCLASM